VKKQSKENFLKLLFTKEGRIACIDGYRWRITALVNAFQVSVHFPVDTGLHARICDGGLNLQITALLDVQNWQSRSEEARKRDQRILDDNLRNNQNALIEQMGKTDATMVFYRLMRLLSESQHNNLVAMIVALQRKLAQQSTQDQERLFFSESLTSLTTLSGRRIQVEDWMITSYEVDFFEEIGSGGLYVH
jgi:hypothetical protein